MNEFCYQSETVGAIVSIGSIILLAVWVDRKRRLWAWQTMTFSTDVQHSVSGHIIRKKQRSKENHKKKHENYA